jgi:hypothetical protein
MGALLACLQERANLLQTAQAGDANAKVKVKVKSEGYGQRPGRHQRHGHRDTASGTRGSV